MTLYAKPVWQLMHDMAQDLGLAPGQAFSRQQALAWFARYYPRVKPGTVSAHLARLSTNAPSRVHFNPRPGQDDLFFQLDAGHYRLYDPRNDPPPIRDGVPSPARQRPPRRAQAGPSLSDEVADPAFRERLARLASAPLDTVIREAGVVLEDRLRSAGGIQGTLYGAELVEAVLAPKTGRLVLSTDARQQEGVMLLFQGAMRFVRNPPMHRLIEYREKTARSLLRLVDSLLLLLSEGAPAAPPPAPPSARPR